LPDFWILPDFDKIIRFLLKIINNEAKN
jgi:hypothetical protein